MMILWTDESTHFLKCLSQFSESNYCEKNPKVRPIPAKIVRDSMEEVRGDLGVVLENCVEIQFLLRKAEVRAQTDFDCG
jgi:hypothetical protein